jgi:hypothetical protein
VTLAQPPAVYVPPDMYQDERPEWCSPEPLPYRPPPPPEPDRDPVPPDWAPPGGSYRNVRWVPNYTPLSNY